MIISLIAEGFMEGVVAAKLVPFCGHELGTIYGEKGCAFIRQKAVKFCHLATEQSGVLVLTDFRDADAICAAVALQEYILDKLPKPRSLPKTFLCRFAVNELESWLLADREGLARFLSIATSRMPLHPESEVFPKRTLVNLARASRKRIIREGIAPSAEHRASVGPEYTSLMREFIADCWNIEAAMQRAPSLERCVRRLCELAEGE